MTDPDLSRTLRRMALEYFPPSHEFEALAFAEKVAAAVRQEQIEQVDRLAANEREARDRRKAVGDLPAALHHDWRAQGMETVLALLRDGGRR